jgi:hypothetical protein
MKKKKKENEKKSLAIEFARKLRVPRVLVKKSDASDTVDVFYKKINIGFRAGVSQGTQGSV